MKHSFNVSSFLRLGFMSVILTASGSAFSAVPQPYGALAYSPSDGLYGVATMNATQEGADQEALGMCSITAGGRSCRVVSRFANACGAISKASDGAWGAGVASTTRGELMAGINAAHNIARQHCQYYGGTDCSLLQASCSFDPVQ